MKVLFLTHIEKNDSNGVWKKVKAQVDALINLGYSVDFLYRTTGKNAVLEKEGSEVDIPLLNKYLIFSEAKKIINDKYDVVYLRKPHGGGFPLSCARLLKHIRLNGLAEKLIMEIPTYPFKNEATGFKGKLSSAIFDFFMFKSKGFIDVIYYIGDGAKTIYNIEAISMGNGVDIKKVPVINKRIKTNDDPIVFIGVANLMFWHGYDRVIRSIYNYKGKNDIRFNIIGEGEPELTRLKSLTRELNLDDKVSFLGKKNKNEIVNIMCESDICIDALGRHRSGNNINDSLKSKEYTAMGMPFIKSHIDNSLGEQYFIYQASSNDENLDIDDLITWYRELPKGYENVMRDFAQNNLTWEKIFESIIKVN